MSYTYSKNAANVDRVKAAYSLAKATEPSSDNTCALEDKYKSYFGYWDCWTGGRFTRVENPRPHKFTNLNAVCRLCVETGVWEEL